MYKVIGTDGQHYGPITAEQLRRWLAENRINAQTLVQVEGSPEWRALATFPDFAAEFLKPIRWRRLEIENVLGGVHHIEFPCGHRPELLWDATRFF